MAWDVPRRYDPLPRTLGLPGLPNFSVDELDLHKTAPDTSSNTLQDAEFTMQGHLSPIEEERRFPASNAPLQIHVTARFHDPAVGFTYNRTYHSSQSFIPTERSCRGLVRRIEHCSKEVITRKDSDALNAARCLHRGPKPLRFELTFEVARAGYADIWAERSFKSYQKHALTSASVKEVLRSTHRIVGLFLRRHDEDFEWTAETAHDHFPDRQETVNPSLKGTLNLASVPQSVFIGFHQMWEFVPGYSLELTLKSTSPARQQSEIRRKVKVDSEQNTPVNLGLGEDLLWQAYRSVQDVLDQKKNAFDLEHADCDRFEGMPYCDCQHFDEDALEVGLRIINNLGPAYDHLHRSIQSRLRLFTHPSGQDCDDFINNFQERLKQFRDQTDKKVEKLNDFDFRIAELIGHGWHEKNCARFIIDGRYTHDHHTIEALLGRIRTGVSEILRGNDVAIRMVAYKRGHLILDKALIARNHQSTPGVGSSAVAKSQQESLLGELKARIQHDIDMVCKDSCSIDDMLEMCPGPGQQDLDQLRPALSSYQPYHPSNQTQRQNRPGSPESFSTRPPTPPEIPVRKSFRVFPLVPCKYQENKLPSKAPASERDSAVGINCNNDLSFLKSAVVVAGIPVVYQNGTNGVIHTIVNEGLRPAAEVYPSKEYESDWSSTHSSMPALTESDSPSPEQSMLITPSCMRSCSPGPHGLPSVEDLRAHHFSSPFLMDTSAPNSTTFSVVDRFEDPKVALHRDPVLPSGRPGTPTHPNAKKPFPSNTPNAPGNGSGDEKTPVPHRCIPELTETSDVEGVGNGMVAKHIEAKHYSVKPVSQSPPRRGWKFCRMEDSGEDEVPQPIANCDSSKNLRQATTVQPGSINRMAGLRQIELMKPGSLIPARMSEQTWPKVFEEASSTQPSVPRKRSETNLHGDSGKDGFEVITLDDELSRPKIDLEPDEGSTIATEPMAIQDAAVNTGWIQAGLRSLGMSESTGHVIPFSDSGISIRTGSETTDKSGSEFEEKHVFSPINESAFAFGIDNLESLLKGPDTKPTEPERQTVSGPLVNENARRGEIVLPVSIQDSLTNAVKRPDGPSEDPDSAWKGSTSAAKQPSDPVKLANVKSSGPICTAPAASNSSPSPTHLDLGGARLLPSLPIFSTLRSASHDIRASWSTSSSWEDYVSTRRHSNDSVDTIKASPAGSEGDDCPDSPKRLGTPTAGLLGLHESRWAEFGIRTALTGKPAFDRPSTAQVPESPDSSCDLQPRADQDHADHNMVLNRSSPPRKSLHLRQKKSIGSIMVASRLKGKERKELRKQKSVDLKTLKKVKSRSDMKDATAPEDDDDGAARFPRAMMLVAGLALASSVVSRNHS